MASSIDPPNVEVEVPTVATCSVTLPTEWKLTCGKQFASYEEWELFLKQYQIGTKQQFVKRHSSLLKDITKKPLPNPGLRYREIIYRCKFGGVHKSTACQRSSRTFKSDCPAMIRIALSRSKEYLEICKYCEEHQNHEGSEAFFGYLPENRRLTTEKQKVLELLELRCDKKALQEKLEKEDKKHVSRKDLHNLASQLQHVDDDTLPATVELLEKTYGASVSVLHEDQKFKGLYFCTEEMRHDMSSYPEIVFVDGTYKLFKRNFTLMLLVVEDSEARSKIVGVGIMADEERLSLKWFMECFKRHNEVACEKIRCFMSDKDLTERSVIKELFPDVNTYICQFHTLRTFSREVASNKMNISSRERIVSLEILDRLTKSSCEENYEKTYKEFCEKVPEEVSHYFNKNWHPIRSEWSAYSMIHGNLGNLTNNRLESLNSKIKQVVQRQSTMVGFTKSFFKFLGYRDREATHKRVQQVLRREVVSFESGSDERNYKDGLTDYAFSFVNDEIKKSKYITFSTLETEATKFSIASKDGQISGDHLKCTCATWSSLLLPCRHIFAIRKLHKLPLFDQILCTTRWTKDYSLKTNPLLSSVPELHRDQDRTPTVIAKVKPPHTLTVTQKRSALRTVLNDMLYTASISPQEVYEKKLCILKEIEDCWRRGVEVSIVRNVAGTHGSFTASENSRQSFEPTSGIQAEMQNLSIDETKRRSLSEIANRSTEIAVKTISDIKLPSAIKIVGRPKGALATTLGIPKKRKDPQDSKKN